MRLPTVVSVHVDAARRVVGVTSGDPRAYYADAVEVSRTLFRAPPPGDADVVGSNAYPIDVSLTFAHSKGMIPLGQARPGASRILVASCSEGAGHHGLYPFVGVSRLRPLVEAGRYAVVRPAKLRQALARRTQAALGRRSQRAGGTAAAAVRPVWLYRAGGGHASRRHPRHDSHRGLADLLDVVRAEQRGAVLAPAAGLRVAVYPCAPLQVLADRSDT